jgi:hypothetical protein
VGLGNSRVGLIDFCKTMLIIINGGIVQNESLGWGGVRWGRGEPSLGPHGKLPKMEFGPCGDGMQQLEQRW